MVLPALSLDIWYASRLQRADASSTLVGGNLVAAGSFMVLGLYAISALMVYPRISTSTIPPIMIVGGLMALWFGWVGARFGAWIGTLGAASAIVEAVDRRVMWVGAGSLAMFAALTLLYILTAAPPST